MGDGRKALRILEVGEFSLFKRTMPDQTTLIFTGANPRSIEGLDHRPFGPAVLPGLLRSLKRGEWDVVACFAPASHSAFARLVTFSLPIPRPARAATQ